MDIELKGKVSLITGGARGIGRAIAEKLADSGSNIIVADLMENVALQTANEIKEQYKVETMAVGVDVSKYTSVEESVKKSIDKFTKIDILVKLLPDIWQNSEADEL